MKPNITSFTKIGFKEFIKWTSRLVNHNLKHKIIDLVFLKSSIKKAKPFPSQPWLLEKIDEAVMGCGKLDKTNNKKHEFI